MLKIDESGLKGAGVAMHFPVRDTRPTEAQSAAFAAWTATQPQGAIHSGYRRQILAREGLGPAKLLAQQLRERFEAMVVLGIGGSALGAKTGLSALLWGVAPAEQRKVLVAENLDPLDFEGIWAQIDPAKTCFVVISKSGGTIETMSQMSLILERLRQANLDIDKHFVAITDPKKGALRAWAVSSGVPTLEVPSDVGGRFSVLTPVGLLPLAFAGLDVEALVDGAVKQFEGRVIPNDVVAGLAARLVQLEEGGCFGHVCMPYATKLRDLGDWFVQLWGESLGKIRPSGGAVGQVPVAALGATDQHSLLQLLVEGRRNLVTGFLRVEEWPVVGGRAPVVPKMPVEFAALSYATGRSFGEVLNAELTATAKVFAELGRPHYELKLESLTPATLGALFAFYMDLTVWSAVHLEVNPFDQPGVELGKKLLPGLLGCSV